MDNLSNELNKLKIDKSKRVQARSGSRSGIIVIIAVLLLVGIFFAVAMFRKPSAAATVQIVHPRVESSGQTAVLVATGYVVAHHKIQVGSKIAGRVAWIGVEKGDHVKRDQTVVRLEDSEYRAQFEQARSAYDSAVARLNELERGSRPEEVERARADVERAQADLSTSDAQLKRIEGLVKEGVASRQTLDDAKGRYDSARANLASLTKTYELTKQGARTEQVDAARAEVARSKAAVDYAKTILDATEIRVPSDGTILERNVERGEMVTTSFVGDRGAKSFVVTIADLNDIQVELDINQNDFNRIGPDQPCTVVTDAFPDRVYQCRVDEIAPEANRQKATVQVKVKFTEPDAYIRPEMNAKVTFLEFQKKREADAANTSPSYAIPKRAVLDREDGKAVLTVVDGKVQIRPVKVQKEVGTEAFVSVGLTGTEAIIVGEQVSQLKSGDRVEVK
jgi:HlyD family secretion protein